jgi:basic membrane protein A
VWLTAAIYDWGPYYTEQVQTLLEGDWKKADYYGNIADGFTSLAPFGKRVDAATQAKIEAKQDEIVAETFDIFSGPIKDQDGKERVAEGDAVSFGDQMEMDWFVQGVEGNPGG